MSSLILTVAGIGPGDPELVTVGALRALEKADLVLLPCSKNGRKSVAGEIISSHLPQLETIPFLFPMTGDAPGRDAILREQLSLLENRWREAESVVLPVIGDSTLYATGSYLYNVWREIVPDLRLRLIPGVSAHAAAASRAGEFLAMGEQVLTIIPGTAEHEAISKALACTGVAAIYKPSALKDALKPLVNSAGPWRKIVRLDRAGLPGEQVFEGEDALERADEYLSIMLLWR